MQTFIVTKLINAVPMNRQEYNDFRGWELPEDENGDDDGYLVEYLDGGQANTEQYAGYVSWSPKAVFEKSYTSCGDVSELPEHMIRVAGERVQLEQKLDALKAFFDSKVFATLKIEETTLLRKQAEAMQDYLDILNSRIGRAEAKKDA